MFVTFMVCAWNKGITIQNFHSDKYIAGNTVGNLILRRLVSRALKRDFRPYIRQYTRSDQKLRGKQFSFLHRLINRAGITAHNTATHM